MTELRPISEEKCPHGCNYGTLCPICEEEINQYIRDQVDDEGFPLNPNY